MAPLHIRKIERVMAAVDRTLRRQFPEDYFKRCAYSAFGIHALLLDAGVEAQIVGGDFGAFIVSPDNRRAAVQGFGFGEEQCSHFWVESDGRLLDLGPHYLPRDSSFPVVAMPAVAWPLAEPLPRGLRYRALDRFPPDAGMSSEPIIQARGERFMEACRQRMARQKGALTLPCWMLDGTATWESRIRRREHWALGLKEFEKRAAPADLPF
jgi:hypothetical protein